MTCLRSHLRDRACGRAASIWLLAFCGACGGGFPKLGSDAGGDSAADVAADVKNDAVGLDTGSCTTTGPTHVCGLSPQCGCNAQSTCDVDYPAHADGTVHCV